MEGWQDRVRAAVERPSFGIFEDANRPERNIYYRLQASGTHYLKVVVEFHKGKGVVINHSG
jgi:hypothetical protein